LTLFRVRLSRPPADDASSDGSLLPTEDRRWLLPVLGAVADVGVGVERPLETGPGIALARGGLVLEDDELAVDLDEGGGGSSSMLKE